MRVWPFKVGRQHHDSVGTAVHGVLCCGDGVTKVDRRGLRNDCGTPVNMFNGQFDQMPFLFWTQIGEFARPAAGQNNVDSRLQHTVNMDQIARLVDFVRVILENGTDRNAYPA